MNDPTKVPMPEPTVTARHSPWLAWVALGVLVVLVVPITLRRPLTGDSSIWNVLARLVERGGTPYRDVFETNPPGAIWLHLLVRCGLGSASEALRAFDLVLVGASIAILARLVVRSGRPGSVGVWSAVAMLACYAAQSIWCQCQRDVWMLTFALLGVSARWRQGTSGANSLTLSFAEGLAWGLAASLKPFVLVPWGFVQIVDRRGSLRHWAAFAIGFGSIAFANVAGLVALGAWDSAWDIWLGWNPTYFEARTRLWTSDGLRMLFVQFGAWFAVHLLAVPLAMLTLADSRRDGPTGRDRQILAALYLGWMVQAFALQHWHGYVHVPALLLGIGCIATEPALPRARAWWPAFAAFGVAVLWYVPPLRNEQLGCWPRCFASTVAPETRDRLRGPLDAIYPAGATLADVAPVARFLRERGVGDGELLCYGFSTAVFYDELDLLPASRFATPRFHAIYFPRRREEVLAAIELTRPRYVVTDLVVEGTAESDVDAYEVGNTHGFPWGERVVFRSGRYLVHRVQGAPGDFTAPELVSRSVVTPRTTTLEKGVHR